MNVIITRRAHIWHNSTDQIGNSDKKIGTNILVTSCVIAEEKHCHFLTIPTCNGDLQMQTELVLLY